MTRVSSPSGPRAERFRYTGYEWDRAERRLLCHYALDETTFTERITFHPSVDEPIDDEAVERARWLLYLLAGVSYYKAGAPPVIAVEAGGLTPTERKLLDAFYLDGLGEFAFQNGLDLSGVTIEADDRAPTPAVGEPDLARALIPFGGGLDSIVTVEGIRRGIDDGALFVVSREGDRFDAIEVAIEVTGLPVVRAERQLDDKILRSRELGYLNGHVPVTGIISAIAVTAALLDGRGAVVLSNEWSAGSGNTTAGGREVNHQWSKTLAFEDLFRAALAEGVPRGVEYYSWLRPWSELWVANRFASLGEYHHRFRSCNRAFHINRADRLDHWCGVCDKCVFIDLILAPFLPRTALAAVFDGPEPLDNPDLLDSFRTLCGLSGEIKPFECVGDVDECRVAALLAHARADRAGTPTLDRLVAEIRPLTGDADPEDLARQLSRPLGEHRIPDRHAPDDLLV